MLNILVLESGTLPGEDLPSNCQNLRASIGQQFSDGLLTSRMAVPSLIVELVRLHFDSELLKKKWCYTMISTEYPAESLLICWGLKGPCIEEAAVRAQHWGVHMSFIKLLSNSTEMATGSSFYQNMPWNSMACQVVNWLDIFNILPRQASLLRTYAEGCILNQCSFDGGWSYSFVHAFSHSITHQWAVIECLVGTRDT